MKRGYTTPLYLLPFDHRHSYLKGMFAWSEPLSTVQHNTVADSKQVIYDGFRQAVGATVSVGNGCILVDEEFGTPILRDAAQNNYLTALCTEKSGCEEFEFEYGDDFAAHIEAFNPAFVKALVRYNPEGDSALNRRQDERLRRLSDYCQQTERRFMFELLVPATPEQMKASNDDQATYDRNVRPGLMAQAITALQAAGVEPDVWKIEGLDQRPDCEHIVKTAQRDGRDEVSCIVLGRGADERKVTQWLTVAAAVPGFIGYAVGRTTFWDAVADYEAGKVSRAQASARIAARYGEWARIFEAGRQTRASHITRANTEVKP